MSRPPPRIRMASGQSIDSRRSEHDHATVLSEAASPTDVSFNQDLSLGPSVTNIDTNTINNDSVKVDRSRRRPGSDDLSAVEDGPLFRATMKALEQKTGGMRTKMKKVLKKAEGAHQAQVECNEAMTAFMDALHEAASSNANAVQPALEHYFEHIAREILQYEKQNTVNLQKMVIDPLSKFYNVDIKQAEAKKRDFEDESREYYSYLGRYLGQRQDSMKEKKRAESDSKYQSRRKNFELSRFDYSSFMQDLHGGRKEQEVLSNLTKYAEAQAKSYLAAAKKVEELIPRLDALTYEVEQADREFQSRRTEREGKRRTLEMSTRAYFEPEIIAAGMGAPTNGAVAALAESEMGRSDSVASTLRPTSSQGASTSYQSDLAIASSPPNPSYMAGNGPPPNVTNMKSELGSNKYKGYRDLEEKDHGSGGSGAAAAAASGERSAQRKEGLLWAMSRPGSHADPKGLNKRAWHKFWIVLDQGRLSEYSNWKQRLDLHIEPIDLRMASVREARNAERRFCFEVITPQFKRVYQATSEDDMSSWISAINNALQSAVESSGISRPIIPPSPEEGPTNPRRDIGSVLTGKSSSVSHHGPHSHSKISSPSSINSVYRRITVGARPSYVRNDSNSFQDHPDKLLQIVRNTDQGNCWCADCGSGVKTEWVSINLGIVLCIECSGIHRSLGTHISKVRSLTLDTTSFTTDIVELLLQVGNRVSNMVWEAKLDRSQKPSSVASREHRLKFITAKYVQREFVAPISSTLSHYSTPDETLLASIKKNDIQGVLYGLALGANPNVTDRSRNTHAVFLALAAADPASLSSPVGVSTHTSSTTNTVNAGGGTSSATRANNNTTPPTAKPFAFPIAEILVQNGAEIPTSLPAFPLSGNAQLYLEQRSGRSKNGRPLGDVTTPTTTATPAVGVGGNHAASVSVGGNNIRPVTPSSSSASTGNQSQNPIAIPRTSSHSYTPISSSYTSGGLGSSFASGGGIGGATG
ncbi:MAG: hypothetical protein M1823_003486, partial [Watsoniomyces obsoletus]